MSTEENTTMVQSTPAQQHTQEDQNTHLEQNTSVAAEESTRVQVEANNVGEGRSEQIIDPEKEIRRWCLVKGYAGLLCHLLTIIAIIFVFMFFPPVTEYIHQHGMPVFWITLALGALSLVLVSVSCARQTSYPLNMGVLIIFTACVGGLLGVSYCVFEAEEIVMSVGIAAVTSFILLLFSIQAKLDFTVFRGILIVIITELLMFGILSLTLHNRAAKTVYSALVILPFLLYLIFDSHLIVTGRPRHSLIKNTYALP